MFPRREHILLRNLKKRVKFTISNGNDPSLGWLRNDNRTEVRMSIHSCQNISTPVNIPVSVVDEEETVEIVLSPRNDIREKSGDLPHSLEAKTLQRWGKNLSSASALQETTFGSIIRGFIPAILPTSVVNLIGKLCHRECSTGGPLSLPTRA
jgi:hypothetical protein